MNAMLLERMFAAAIFSYIVGALASLICYRIPAVSRRVACGLAGIGGLLATVVAVAVLITGTEIRLALPSGIPFLEYDIRIDPLSAYFNLALGILVVAISIYSLGYLKPYESRPTLGVLGAFYNALLLSLTLVFSASNAFFFLISWEIMALTAFIVVSYEHSDEETRSAGVLFFAMSHAGTGCLIAAFLLLVRGAGSYDFASLHAIGSHLPPNERNAVFLLFLIGFGVKAGIIPLHIWLPAAHPVAPSNISAIMSGIVIKTGIYGLARVLFDFLGVPPMWWGMVILIVGVASALLGVLYALIEHDLKRLLAYHSIENIGIILMGFGGALVFWSSNHMALAALALVAGLYHTLNHAIFKSLLFLGAGSVVHSTHTRNMEEMGGLIRKLPKTAFCFLVGAVAISGLPPLNGFVSEWLTYQSLLAGFGTMDRLVRLVLPIAGSLLALTGALAAACFVKAFGITFLALPRSEEAKHAHGESRTMVAGMGLLTFACFALGLGATLVLPMFDRITTGLLGVGVGANLVADNGLTFSAAGLTGGTASTAVIFLGLLVLVAIPLLALVPSRRRSSEGPTWDCGLPGLTARNEYTATAFSKPLRIIFSALYRPRREIQAQFEVSPFYPTEIRFESDIDRPFERRLYAPAREWILEMSSKIRAIQAGSVHAYLAYIFLALLGLLLLAVRP